MSKKHVVNFKYVWHFSFSFMRNKIMHSINQQKLLSNITRLVASLWMSSNKIWERVDPLASLANLLATQFPLRLTWEKARDLKLDVSWRESSIKWPKGARQNSSELRDLIIVSKTTYTSWRPIFRAKDIALRQAKASTSSTDGGKAILSESAPMTLPSWSLITTPRPAAAMSWKMAPSKLALNHRQRGGDQWTKEGGSSSMMASLGPVGIHVVSQ